MFVYVCFVYICRVIGFVGWIDKGLIIEEFRNVHFAYDLSLTVLCGWQDSKIHLLTNFDKYIFWVVSVGGY